MSQWTHINANIRIDDLENVFLKKNNFLAEIKEFLGPIIDFETSEEEWEKCKLPLGSEGSIYYYVLPPTEHSYQAVVNFFGDLRDFPSDSEYHKERSIESIETWFTKICKKYCIRQAVLQISVEYGSEIILFTYDDADYKTHIHKIEFTRRQQLLSSKKDTLADYITEREKMEGGERKK